MTNLHAYSSRYPSQWLQLDRGASVANVETVAAYGLSTMCGECPTAWTLYGTDDEDSAAEVRMQWNQTHSVLSGLYALLFSFKEYYSNAHNIERVCSR